MDLRSRLVEAPVSGGEGEERGRVLPSGLWDMEPTVNLQVAR